MFISKDYIAKMWPSFERKIILKKQVKVGEYLLPVRFDKAHVPGLDPDLGYQDARVKTPQQIANIFESLFFERLKF